MFFLSFVAVVDSAKKNLAFSVIITFGHCRGALNSLMDFLKLD